MNLLSPFQPETAPIRFLSIPEFHSAIYVMDVSSVTVSDNLNWLSADRREKLLRYRRPEDRQLLIGADYLLLCALSKMPEFAEKSTEELRLAAVRSVDSYGKPFLSDYPGICFNLSHSGCYAACAVGPRPLGIDIQIHQPDYEKLIDSVCTSDEKERLHPISNAARMTCFYNIWSLKESYVKALGRGFSVNPRSVSTVPCSGIRYSDSPCSDTRYSDSPCSDIRYSDSPCSGIRYSVISPENPTVCDALLLPDTVPGYSLAVCICPDSTDCH